MWHCSWFQSRQRGSDDFTLQTRLHWQSQILSWLHLASRVREQDGEPMSHPHTLLYVVLVNSILCWLGWQNSNVQIPLRPAWKSHPFTFPPDSTRRPCTSQLATPSVNWSDYYTSGVLLNRDGFNGGECLQGGAEADEKFVNVSLGWKPSCDRQKLWLF